MREAARVHPDVAGLVGESWRALRAPRPFRARRSRRTCARIEIDDDERSALANLVLVYDALGETELAAGLPRARAGLSRAQPVLALRSGRARLRAAQFTDALASLRKALRLKRDEHEFYTLRGQVLTALGRSRDATQSFERAREYEAIEYDAQPRVALACSKGSSDP